jgi:hypothetical protein
VASAFSSPAFGQAEPVRNLATPLGTAHSLCSAAFENDIFVAVIPKGSETSTDGITWAEHPCRKANGLLLPLAMAFSWHYQEMMDLLQD